MNDDDYKIRVIRQASCSGSEDPCADDETCFVLGEVPGRPGLVQAVARTVTNPYLRAMYRHQVMPGEVLVEFDRADIGETCRAVGEVLGRPDLVLAVGRTVTDLSLIAAYSYKIGPGELLVEFDKVDIAEVVAA